MVPVPHLSQQGGATPSSAGKELVPVPALLRPHLRVLPGVPQIRFDLLEDRHPSMGVEGTSEEESEPEQGEAVWEDVASERKRQGRV